MWWQLLTCGFVHHPTEMGHILFNMLALFFLGRDVEEWYGTREFIRLYLATLVFSSLVWAVATRLFDPRQASTLLGASGAISGVVVLYALNFPKRILLFMFVVPLPAWLLGVLVIAFDIWGAMHRGDNVAYTAHLGGAAFALAYFNLRWNFGRMLQSAAAWLKGRSRPSLKVFKPEDGPNPHVADEDVDRILEKIHREGEGSLTRKERRVLENASREYQRRRRPE
jgi:membrane associated rhomboid family serine protease